MSIFVAGGEAQRQNGSHYLGLVCALLQQEQAHGMTENLTIQSLKTRQRVGEEETMSMSSTIIVLEVVGHW